MLFEYGTFLFSSVEEFRNLSVATFFTLGTTRIQVRWCMLIKDMAGLPGLEAGLRGRTMHNK